MTYLNDTGLATFYAGLNTKFVKLSDCSGPDKDGNMVIETPADTRDDFSYTVAAADWIWDSTNGYWYTDTVTGQTDDIALLDTVIVLSVIDSATG